MSYIGRYMDVEDNTRFKELTTEIRREMNGAVSGSMRCLDPAGQRKINFGVSLPTIKQICLRYGRNHSLAEELRKHNVREWWLAAAYIDTPENIDIEYAEYLSSQWKSVEEADVYALELLSLSPNAIRIATEWISSTNKLKARSAGRIVACIAKKLPECEARKIIETTSEEIPVRAIYEHHPTLRFSIREKGPYLYSWILDEIDITDNEIDITDK